MNQIFLKPKQVAVVTTIVAAAIVAVVFSTLSAQAVQTTSVTATVASTVSCAPDGSTAALGTLLVGSVSTASPAITVTNSCNSGGGCTIYVNDAGNTSNPGLYASAATGTPLIASATATLAAGTEGYGLQATTTGAGTGSALTLSATYDKSGNDVGGLAIAATQIASASAPFSAKVITVDTKAAISVLTKAGTYADTITYSCVGI
jgi:hypothetical protein